MDDISDTSKTLQAERKPNANDFIGGRRMNINQLRNQMIKIGQVHGLSNQWTVALSKILEDLIFEEQLRRMKG